jgi:hypothetical protein
MPQHRKTEEVNVSSNGWVGVDLDGTLAFYDHWRGPEHIGAPIPAMLERVKRWIAEGREVRIFTARVDNANGDAFTARRAIEAYCQEHVGEVLPITNQKDYRMVEMWDDRCVQVIPNTGRTIADELESERMARAGKQAGH